MVEPNKSRWKLPWHKVLKFKLHADLASIVKMLTPDVFPSYEWLIYKYVGQLTPKYLKKWDIWVVDPKYKQELRFKDDKIPDEFKVYEGAEAGNLEYVMAEFAKTGLFFPFWTKKAREENHPEHEHTFEGVLTAMLYDVKNFSIEGLEQSYSQQEREFLNAVLQRYAEIEAENKSN